MGTGGLTRPVNLGQVLRLSIAVHGCSAGTDSIGVLGLRSLLTALRDANFGVKRAELG